MKTGNYGSSCLLIAAITLAPFLSYAGTVENPAPSAEQGAIVFQARCTLCHGNFGLGEGVIPLIIKGYPGTNLHDFSKNTDEASLRNKVLHGGIGDQTSELSPPWGSELSYTAVESLVQFLQLFYTNNDAAISLLEKARDKITTEPKINVGMAIYRSRCMVCHGLSGNADGAMAKRLKTAPANLIKSRAEDTYLTNIISHGGESVSRSFQMPPWEGTLSKFEISSVVLYIKTLRE